MTRAETEIGLSDKYDFVIVNDSVGQAAADLREAVEKARESREK